MTLAPYRIVYLPVGFAEAADRIVDLVERGVMQAQDHWHSREACQAFIDRQPRGLHQSYAPTCAIIRVAGDAERGFGPESAAPTALQGRRSVRVSGKHLIEGTDGRVNGPVPVIGLAVASRPFDDQEARHVA